MAEVVDGDTIKIRYDNGTADTVRLLGVDTPEVHVENTPEEWEGVPNTEAGKQCLREAGHEASDYVKQRLSGEQIRLEFDENEDRRGYYNRLLAYVYIDGKHINYQLVEQGYGRVYDTSFTKHDRFSTAEDNARQQEKGAWRCRNIATPTATPTPSPTPTPDDGNEDAFTIESIHTNAEGYDHDNLNDEYIVFKNTGDAPLDLGDWTVSDEKDHTYHFPQGFTLDPGTKVTLHTGSGENSETGLYWGSGRAVWNNGGDTIIVENENGEEVITHTYPEQEECETTHP